MIYRKHEQAVDVFIPQKPSTTLFAVNFGWEKTKADFHELSITREYTLLHFVTEGEGYLKVNRHQYALKAGNVFIIHPGVMVSYGNIPGKTPLEFSWVGFKSRELTEMLARAGLKTDQPVIECICCSKVQQMIEQETAKVLEQQRINPLSANALLFNCTDCVAEVYTDTNDAEAVTSTSDDQLQAILLFVKNNYNKAISVDMLCQTYHISPTSLWRIFHSRLGVSPTQYIRSLRIQMACDFLRNGMRVKDVAIAVGWQDQYLFSKVFKKEKGLSPREYSRMNLKI